METCHELVQRIAALVEDRYVFPAVAAGVASALRSNLNAGAYELEPAELAMRLTEDLRALSGDLHLRVRCFPEPRQPESPGAAVTEHNDREAHCRSSAFGVAHTCVHPGGVGVIDVREFVELAFSRSAFEAALASFSGASALVFDLRQCVGGDPYTVALVCSHLVDERTQLSSIVPRAAPSEAFWADPTPYPKSFGGKKPVFVATAAFTFSGAEQLAYDLQVLRRAVIVGAVTGGGANPCAFYWPSPHFSVLMPEAQAINPITGSNWEGRGVTPDVLCPEHEALHRAIELAGTHTSVA